MAVPSLAAVLDWLLDSDPALRWQVLRDLGGASPAEIAAERARVATEGWGAQLLALQDSDGRWDGGTYRPGWVDDSKPFFDAWTATHFSLWLLRDFGLDPTSPHAQHAVSLVRENVRWNANDALYFDGETEPCINGIALANGAYFGQPVQPIVRRLLNDQLPDGGWNCWAEHGAKVSSFHTTICVLEGLLEWERTRGSSSAVTTVTAGTIAADTAAVPTVDAVTAARHRGEDYLLERKLFRRRSTGQIVDPRFTMFSFPTRWYYDVLRALDYFRATAAPPDHRLDEALDLLHTKRDESGRWPLENSHEGPTHFQLEGSDNSPSRWNTLRALRILKWAGLAA